VIAVLRARESLGVVLALPIRPVRWVFLPAPHALALPLSVTAHGPARWIVSSGVVAGTPPRLQSVLSAAWQMVAG